MGLVWQGVHRLASLRLTLVLLVLLALGVWLALRSELRTTWTLVVPLALVAVNLSASLLVSPVFRRHPGLLVFHLALLAILLLVAAGRLTYLSGFVDVATGQAFEGRMTVQEAGPLHGGGLAAVAFVNEGFTIDYSPGQHRDRTHNRVSWHDQSGTHHTRVIGDNTPLVREGYRFYTTHNKGFAPVFIWEPADGSRPQRGSVHLPSYPLNDFRQAAEWTPPGAAQALWVMLEIEEELLPADRAAHFRVPEAHHLLLRVDGERLVLRPGDGIELSEGHLSYIGLTTWMGYRVYYDWTIHWLFAAAVLGVAGLGWHYWVKYNRRPWRPRYIEKEALHAADGALGAEAQQTETPPAASDGAPLAPHRG